MFREFNWEMPFKFEDDLSKTDLGDISVRLPSVKLEKLKITPGSRVSEIDVHDGDKLYANLKARQPFPLSAPQIIILEDRSGEELMTIPDLKQLDETSKEVLKKGVRANNFTLKINSIRKWS